ncbi:MAG: type II secretion system protein GspI [Gammaproteobacteria bacterium]|nr:type II secretion system protein GspI [Gammaproteobacteria bacterium]OUV67868.1 MAG: type II secretion system protein GspI [Gammaproteobacteria bacterium TMED133]
MVIVMLIGSNNKGFTLIEVIIALSIVAIVSTTVFKSVTESVIQSRGLKERVVAQWIAENEIAKIHMLSSREEHFPAIGTERFAKTMVGQTWQIEVRVLDTENPLMRRIEVTVFQDSNLEVAATQLISFMGRY